jgi:DNA (cytosine-5)-methyltransferase 1
MPLQRNEWRMNCKNKGRGRKRARLPATKLKASIPSNRRRLGVRKRRIEMPRILPQPRHLFPESPRGVENPWLTRFRLPIASSQTNSTISALEICAGGGGQALGFEMAGIDHAGLVEIEKNSCETLRLNRPKWNVIQADLNHFDPKAFEGVDIVCGGLPCPPFSIAGKQLGHQDERNLFPAMIRLVDRVHPRAVMIENVRGILDAVFVDYRQHVEKQLQKLGYVTGWKLLNAADFSVPQLRPRVVFIAIQKPYAADFIWPEGSAKPRTVGETLFDLMASNDWKGVRDWKKKANEIAPTIVGGSLKHGGPDLGPTRARRAWATLGVDGLGIAAEAPGPHFSGMPRLTVRMVARLQGFPDEWQFFGKKTQSYRQVGNAFPPPVASAVAARLKHALTSARRLAQVAG